MASECGAEAPLGPKYTYHKRTFKATLAFVGAVGLSLWPVCKLFLCPSYSCVQGGVGTHFCGHSPFKAITVLSSLGSYFLLNPKLFLCQAPLLKAIPVPTAERLFLCQYLPKKSSRAVLPSRLSTHAKMRWVRCEGVLHPSPSPCVNELDATPAGQAVA
jgi:hypothetical protein